MPRRHRCPMPHCPKRGSPSALAHHRRDKHPEIDPGVYQAWISGRKSPLPTRRSGLMRLAIRSLIALAVFCATLAVAYIVHVRLS